MVLCVWSSCFSTRSSSLIFLTIGSSRLNSCETVRSLSVSLVIDGSASSRWSSSCRAIASANFLSIMDNIGDNSYQKTPVSTGVLWSALLLWQFGFCFAICLRFSALHFLALTTSGDGSFFGNFFLEFFNTSSGVDQFLLAGVERMAI